MHVRQLCWSERRGWTPEEPEALGVDWHLMLCFWSATPEALAAPLEQLGRCLPGVLSAGCSTAGEIHQDKVLDDSLTVTLIRFHTARALSVRAELEGAGQSLAAGERLAASLPRAELRHVLVFASGLEVNGSELARGLCANLPEGVTSSGGLAGDGDRFERTFVLLDGVPHERAAVAVGLYGASLEIGCGSQGGWDVFGPERLITASAGNVLLELDGCNALELYERYLGKLSAGLPATALLFPLSIRRPGCEGGLVRTILGIDRERRRMIFAGDMPEGAYARLMKAHFGRLVDGATDAAVQATAARRARLGPNAEPGLALLISCVGRKLLLKQLVEEEVESVADVIGADVPLAGYYSYGELAPNPTTGHCELHNQTMTITTISER